MHRSTMARRIATEITRTGYPTKNIFRSINKLIFASYMGRMPYTFVHFGGFLCIKDAGRRGDKITVLIFFIIIMIIVLLVHGKSHTRGTNEIHSIYMRLIQPPI